MGGWMGRWVGNMVNIGGEGGEEAERGKYFYF